MRCPSISLCGFLWVWLPLFHSRPVKIDKVVADTRSLTKTIIARIQEHQFPPVSPKVNGFDFIPGQLPVESLESIDETLEIFHQLLSSLPPQVPVTQISNDVENLRSLLQMLGSHLRCPLQRPSVADALGNLTELMAISPYTRAVVTLDRLQKCLQSIAKYLDHVQNC
ncbi:leptin [Rhineura floridana]|uniref:leptin n=1 Tax=Rhineura floridana TaxID=261503 RepID=UPI002AC86C40|nr:leptin [Rhineura floridana]